MLLLVVAVSVCLGWTMHKVLQQTVAVSALLEMDASYGVNYADPKIADHSRTLEILVRRGQTQERCPAHH